MSTVRGRAGTHTRLAALAAAVTLLAACGAPSAGNPGAGNPGAGTPGAGTPGASTPSPTAPSAVRPGPLPTTLREARAAWKATAAAKDYTLQVEQSCFCPAVRVTSTVTAGRVTDSEVEPLGGKRARSAAASDGRRARTVEDLFALIERYDAERVQVTYSAQGVPLSVVGDPVPDAVDDEFTYTVLFRASAGGTRPDADRSWSKTRLPAGLSWPTSAADGGPAGAQALITRKGGAARVYLALWGSSSCPAVPLTLRPAGVRERPSTPARPKEPVVTVGVDVDATTPAGRACTEDYGPTVYVATLPASLASAGTLPNLQLVTSVATDAQDGPGVRAFVVPVTHA